MQMEDKANAATPSWPEDADELLERIQKEWSALMHSIATVTAEQMTTSRAGGWSIKDNLAHLAVWEEFLLHHHLQGQPPHRVLHIDAATFERLDEDGLNAVIYEQHKDRSVDDVLGDLKRIHDQVVAKLEQMTFTELTQPHYADDPTERPMMDSVIGNTYEHYQEHRVVIEAII